MKRLRNSLPTFLPPALLISLALSLTNSGCQRAANNQVVVYTSTDQVFSEPVLKKLERQTGIKIRAVFDTEETKSTGLVNRLIAERARPQCDVFWSNDVLRVEILKRKGILAKYQPPEASSIPAKFKDPEGYWTGFSGRIRVLLANTDLVSEDHMPSSISDLIDPRWKGKVAFANPLFGTTSFHVASLYVLWGDAKARKFFNSLRNNGLQLASSNGEVARWVAQGKAAIGVVDNDDAFSALEANYPVKMIIPDQENGMGTLFIPNAVAVIAGAPHRKAAEKVVSFLLSKETEEMLASLPCRQIPLNGKARPPEGLPPLSEIKTYNVDYSEVAAKMEELVPELEEWVSAK